MTEAVRIDADDLGMSRPPSRNTNYVDLTQQHQQGISTEEIVDIV